MTGAAIHYEIYVRRKKGAPWALEMATEDRALAVSTAEAMFKDGRCVAAKVSKETLDDETREFKTVTIVNLGAPEMAKKSKIPQTVEPLCVTPQDLYTIHARERIARLLEAWLKRHRATAYELLHRPDLVEALESSGVELQHALQKISIPEAEARGCSVHEMIRTYLALAERSFERVLTDARKGRLLQFRVEGFAGAAIRVARDPEAAYLLGSGVAAILADALTAPAKVKLLLDLADAAPTLVDAPRAVALAVIEQPLSEILASKTGLHDVLGGDLELGAMLAAMTFLTAPKSVAALIKVEPSVARMMPALPPTADRLAGWLAAPEFSGTRMAIGRRIIEELSAGRRLRPDDPMGEIEVLRALGMSLTVAAHGMLPPEDVTAAFSMRSRMLVTNEFVTAYLGEGKTARGEVEALIWLAENVIGAANKRQASQWLRNAVASLRLEKELRQGAADSPAARLGALAQLQRAVSRCGLEPEDVLPIHNQLGALGGLVEADAHITAAVARAKAPAHHRLALLLKLAIGETAPLGPAADRAKAEAMKLVRADETRRELARSPEQMEAVRGLIQQAGLAA